MTERKKMLQTNCSEKEYQSSTIVQLYLTQSHHRKQYNHYILTSPTIGRKHFVNIYNPVERPNVKTVKKKQKKGLALKHLEPYTAVYESLTYPWYLWLSHHQKLIQYHWTVYFNFPIVILAEAFRFGVFVSQLLNMLEPVPVIAISQSEGNELLTWSLSTQGYMGHPDFWLPWKSVMASSTFCPQIVC